MMSWDAIVTIAIIVLAVLYLVRKFSRGKKEGTCGCGSDGGCCSTSSPTTGGACGGHRHR